MLINTKGSYPVHNDNIPSAVECLCENQKTRERLGEHEILDAYANVMPFVPICVRVTYGKLNDFNNSPVYFNDGSKPNAEIFLQGRMRNCKIRIVPRHTVRTTRMKQLESFAIYGENDSYYEQR